jgi:hypothetical protein
VILIAADGEDDVAEDDGEGWADEVDIRVESVVLCRTDDTEPEQARLSKVRSATHMDFTFACPESDLTSSFAMGICSATVGMLTMNWEDAWSAYI